MRKGDLSHIRLELHRDERWLRRERHLIRVVLALVVAMVATQIHMAMQ